MSTKNMFDALSQKSGMFKRGGNSKKYLRKNLNQHQMLDEDFDFGLKISCDDKASSCDSFGLLSKFLKQHVGKPWNDVYSLLISNGGDALKNKGIIDYAKELTNNQYYCFHGFYIENDILCYNPRPTKNFSYSLISKDEVQKAINFLNKRIVKQVSNKLFWGIATNFSFNWTCKEYYKQAALVSYAPLASSYDYFLPIKKRLDLYREKNTGKSYYNIRQDKELSSKEYKIFYSFNEELRKQMLC